MNWKIIKLLAALAVLSSCSQNQSQKSDNPSINKDTSIMKNTQKESTTAVDNSNKSILARGCDPTMSLQFSKVVPPLIGNATYVPTTDDTDFIKKLESRKWSVIFFAPGACRYSAAAHQIPGGNYDTAGWTLNQYKELIYKLQGTEVQIVESLNEQRVVSMLNEALDIARETN